MAEDSNGLRDLERKLERQLDRIEIELKHKPGQLTISALMLAAIAIPIGLIYFLLPREIDRMEKRFDEIRAQNDKIETTALSSQKYLADINVAFRDLPKDIAKLAVASRYAVTLPDDLWFDLIKSGKSEFVNFSTLGDDGYLFIIKSEFEKFPEELKIDLIEFGNQDKIHVIIE